MREIVDFYRNYHSSRFVRDTLVLRVRRAPDPQALEALNDEFADTLVRGKISVGEALPEEADEVAALPRVLLGYDRRRAGRLRTLIDRLNEIEPAEPGARDALPHEVFERPLPPEVARAEDEDA